jgi:hypothetical protein
MVMGTFATWSIITLIGGLTVLTGAIGPRMGITKAHLSFASTITRRSPNPCGRRYTE